MSHFAKVENGLVTNVIVAEQDFIDTLPDKEKWIQTSYNTRGNVHYAPNSSTPDGGTALRGNYASPGHIYDATEDVFYIKQPFKGWVLNKTTWLWEPPYPMPTDYGTGTPPIDYTWNENSESWERFYDVVPLDWVNTTT
jgi:hypothetical protein